MQLIIYTADCTGNAKNCKYPHRAVVTNTDELQEAVSRDHVCAEYRGNYRSVDNFISSNVVVMDCDNDHSENPADWMTPEKMEEIFADVAYGLALSRHHLIEKDGKAARPKFHVYFEIEEVRDAGKYAALKRAIHREYPFFDGNALDAGRFLFGSSAGDVVWHDGWMTIDVVIGPMEEEEDDFTTSGVIPAGQRNNAMNLFAGKVLKRYGETEKAYQVYLERAAKCDPPLEEDELKTIWYSALKFYRKKVKTDESYVAPDAYNDEFAVESLKPEDYSDIGQAKVVAREYGDELKYTDATDFLRYNGEYWMESKQQAVAVMEDFLDLQLADALAQFEAAKKSLMDAGIDEKIVNAGGKALEKVIEPEMLKAYYAYLAAKQYVVFVMKRRDMKYVTSALMAAKPMLAIDVSELDGNEFLLNVPGATFDLRDASSKEPEAEDYITKQALAAPGDEGMDKWLEALDLFFCKDQSLIDYVQQIVGMAAIGKVYMEVLIIAYGEGSNGKSTFWNSISRVLGSYSGNISADALTIGCKRNVKPEMAELKGRRLVIAAEMEEGQRLNTSVVKQICSTDEIYAEKKYKDPFKFTPSHTVVLYTNHLPRVGASDNGIWRRLIVIPFNAKIEGSGDVKNYADELVSECAPAIMKWIIEGARKVIAAKYKLKFPKCVEEAISRYRESNNWFGLFVEECCEVNEGHEQKSGEFYQEYRAFCLRTGEYPRSTTDFYSAVDAAGYTRRRTRKGFFIYGIRLKNEDFVG